MFQYADEYTDIWLIPILKFLVSDTGIESMNYILDSDRIASIIEELNFTTNSSQNLVIITLSSRVCRAGCQMSVRLAGKDFICLHGICNQTPFSRRRRRGEARLIRERRRPQRGVAAVGQI